MIDEITVAGACLILLLAIVEIGCVIAAIRFMIHRADMQQQERRERNRIKRLKDYAEANRIKHNRRNIFEMISGEKELYRR